MRRRLQIVAACLAGLLAGALAFLPWWLGPVLARIGRPQGATFAAYERVGYARFVLRDVAVRRAGMQWEVSQVEADTPVVWLWHRWTGRSTEIIAGKWTVVVENPRQVATRTSAGPARIAPAPVAGLVPVQPSANGGWLPVRTGLMSLATGLAHWLPQARTGAGEVNWPGGALTCTSAALSAHTLVVANLQLGPWQGTATVTFPAAETMQLVLQSAGANNTAILTSRGTDLTGHGTWWAQPVTLKATFGAQGWLPLAATLQADSWTVPGARLKLGDLYPTVQGHGKIEWRDNRFSADVAATGQPLADGKVPPLEATLRGRGDAQSFTIEELHATLPGISAQLSAPVTFNRHGDFAPGSASFHFAVDLARQPWFTAQGTVSGEARLVAGVTPSPVVEFEMKARGVTAGALTLSKANATGRVAWPRLEVTDATITLSPEETLTGRGGWDFQTAELLDAACAGKIRRVTLARWLPAPLEFNLLAVEAKASGPLEHLAHAGTAQADGLKWSGLNPLALAATWRGQGRSLDNFTAEAKAGDTTLTAAGSTTRDAIHLTDLTLGQGNATRLKLSAPATVTWKPALQIDSLQMAGEGDASVAVLLGATGHAEFTLHKVSSAWLADLAPRPGPVWQVNTLTFTGQWDHGPMTYTLTANSSVALGNNRTANLDLSAHGDKNEIKVDTLRASEGTEVIFQATGRAPLVISPGSSTWWQINPDGELAIEANTQPNRPFWTKLGELTGVAVTEPQATAHLRGTWMQPLGEIHLQAGRITVDPTRFKRALPGLDSLEAMLTGDRHGLKLDTFSVRIEGQMVRAQGRLQVAQGAWAELIKDPLGVAQRSAELHLAVPDADLAAWVRILPPWLAPKGRLQVDLNYRGGGPVQGFLHLHGAATRPLGPLGVLQEINAEVQLKGRLAELSQMTATAGGRIVTLSGTIEFPDNEAPRYAMTLRGTNLPFVRQSGLLVRGDLDLTLRTPAAGPPVIGGTVHLRNSLFLSDVRSFLPGDTKGDPLTPPYFAVETAPLNTWKLNVGVTGERFLLLRTPVFNGTASAQFQLSGTLGEPRAIGEVTINQGRVLLPFATFTVKQGFAQIAEANPHELTIFLRATGRRYDYELTMEVTGTPEAPNVVFTSSPALDSKQLLLMVMTGVAPQNELTVSSSQRYARLGTYLGQSLLTNIGGDATSADRLSIATGENITRQGRESYKVEYKLADRWKLIGEYDEFDDYNVGLKWRLYPGKHQTDAPPDDAK